MRGTRWPPRWPLLLSVVSLASLVLAGAFASLGCQSSASDDAPPVARADYCQKLAKDACTRDVSCCNAAGITTDDATCIERERSSCESLATTAESKGHAYDAQAAGNCLAGTKMFHEGCAARQPGFWESRKVVDACARVFHGTAQVGQACKVDDDCAPSSDALVSCQAVTSGTAGARECVAFPRAERGEKCNLSADGATTFVGCKNDSICTGPRSTSGAPVETRCLGPAAAGEACNATNARSCADGLTCDPTTDRCVAPRGLGEQCGLLPCAGALVCQWTTNRCVAKIEVGQACRESDTCIDGAACVRGECRTLSPEGAACSSSDECLARRCEFASGDYTKGTCAQYYGGASGGIDPAICRAIQVK